MNAMSQVTRQEQSQAAVAAGTRIVALAYGSTLAGYSLAIAGLYARDSVELVCTFFLVLCSGIAVFPILFPVGSFIGWLSCQMTKETTLSPVKFAIALASTLSAIVVGWVMVLILRLSTSG